MRVPSTSIDPLIIFVFWYLLSQVNLVCLLFAVPCAYLVHTLIGWVSVTALPHYSGSPQISFHMRRGLYKLLFIFNFLWSFNILWAFRHLHFRHVPFYIHKYIILFIDCLAIFFNLRHFDIFTARQVIYCITLFLLKKSRFLWQCLFHLIKIPGTEVKDRSRRKLVDIYVIKLMSAPSRLRTIHC